MTYLQALISLFTHRLIVLAILYILAHFLYGKFIKGFDSIQKDGDLRTGFEFLFLILGIVFWTSIMVYSHTDLMAYVFFQVVFISMSKFQIEKKPRALVLSFLLSILSGFIIWIVLNPIYKQVGGYEPVMRFLLLDVNAPNFYFFYILFLLSIVSFMLGFISMCYSKSIATIIVRQEETSFTTAESILSILQTIPLLLFPIFLAQTLGSIDLLEPIVMTMYSIFLTFFHLLPYCIVISFMTRRFFRARFILITSIFSLISFLGAIYASFQFIAWNVNSGTMALGVIMSSLLSSSIGVILSRISFSNSGNSQD